MVGLYSNIEIAKNTLEEYNKTGRLPTQTPLGLKGFVRRINGGFPAAKTYIDIETINKIDALIKGMYETIIAKLKEDTAKLKEDNRILETLIKAL